MNHVSLKLSAKNKKVRILFPSPVGCILVTVARNNNNNSNNNNNNDNNNNNNNNRQSYQNGETEAKRKHTEAKTWSHNFRICGLRRPSHPNLDPATNIMRTAGLFRCGIGCAVVMVVALAVVAAKPLWLWS